MAAPVKPDIISTLGFQHAPVTKFLLITTGVSSITVALLPSQYRNLLGLPLDWTQVVRERQIWRLITSQFIIDESLTDLISNCFLVYNFLILERRWGSAKYVSFLLTTWSVSFGIYFSLYKLGNYASLQMVPSGLYGPLFALFVYYSLDVHQEKSNSRFFSVLSNKFLVYMVMLQCLISVDSPGKSLICLCGTIKRVKVWINLPQEKGEVLLVDTALIVQPRHSNTVVENKQLLEVIAGIMYRTNITKLQSWFPIPDLISKACHTFFSYLGITSTQHVVSQKVFMGATPEIQEDIMYDYMMKKQQTFQRILNGGRVDTGQGYSDVMNPSIATILRNFGGDVTHQSGPVPSPPVHRQPTPPPPLPGHLPLETDSVPEEKVQKLIDMGFARDSVVKALASVDNDIQQATTILLSADSST